MPSTMPLSTSAPLLRLYGPMKLLSTSSHCCLLSNCCEFLEMLYFVGLTLRGSPPPAPYLCQVFYLRSRSIPPTYQTPCMIISLRFTPKSAIFSDENASPRTRERHDPAFPLCPSPLLLLSGYLPSLPRDVNSSLRALTRRVL
jgi:hypothetical protein